MVTQQGAQCQRAAAWLINLHGCERVVACGQHMNAWKRETRAQYQSSLSPRCAHCRNGFDKLDDAYTVTPL